MAVTSLTPQNFEWFSGDDYLIEFTVTDEDGAAVDLTNASATWSMARRNTSSALLTKTLGSGINVTDAVNGVLQVSLDAADGASFEGDYYHELEVTLSGGAKRTVAYGTVTVPIDLIT